MFKVTGYKLEKDNSNPAEKNTYNKVLIVIEEHLSFQQAKVVRKANPNSIITKEK